MFIKILRNVIGIRGIHVMNFDSEFFIHVGKKSKRASIQVINRYDLITSRKKFNDRIDCCKTCGKCKRGMAIFKLGNYFSSAWRVGLFVRP